MKGGMAGFFLHGNTEALNIICFPSLIPPSFSSQLIFAAYFLSLIFLGSGMRRDYIPVTVLVLGLEVRLALQNTELH